MGSDCISSGALFIFLLYFMKNKNVRVKNNMFGPIIPKLIFTIIKQKKG